MMSSPLFNFDGSTCVLTSNSPDTFEFAYLTRPPLDDDGCYSISVKCTGEWLIGFAVSDIVRRSMSNRDEWNTVTNVNSSFGKVWKAGFGIGHSTRSLFAVKRDLGTDTMTVSYSPADGNMFVAYNLERFDFLFRKDIPVSIIPLQPFVASTVSGSSITIVCKPRFG